MVVVVMMMMMITRLWPLDRVQTHDGHSIAFNWNMFLRFVTCDLDL